MTRIAALALAVFAYTLLSAGLVLMKKGIGWIGHKNPKDGVWSRNLTTWIAGFLLSNLYIVPIMMALKTLEPHIVAAMAGWGVIVLILLSRAIIGERLYPLDAAYATAIVLAIALLNLYDRPGPGNVIKVSFIIAAAFFPVGIFCAAFIKRFSGRIRGVLFAVTSGASGGMMVVLMKILIRQYGYQVDAYFGSIFLYLYLFFSIMAFLSLQLAFKLETMMWTGPVQYALSIVYPAMCSAFVFGNPMHPVQIVALPVLVISATGIFFKR